MAKSNIRSKNVFTIILWLNILLISYSGQANQLQDPTRPVNHKATLHVKKINTLPTLTAIFIEKKEMRAIFNTGNNKQEKAKQVGQLISGYKVQEIALNYVILNKNNKQYRLKLFPEITKESKRN